ncbi:CDP-alcohol phosphatidyltransferase family protein [Caldivirga sp.]|uniref:CDP-alcohol phosphatidyltransferase family protein n=1 Tax=Caldivirga sp. TaxID=2080243 RepID=UPI0025C2BCFD|nr:CDP-alcohol phosphatidyltransferase family protein [Caldivirga sp.]
MIGRIKSTLEHALERIAPVLPRNPNLLTVLGLLASLISIPVALIKQYPILLPIVILVSGFFDVADGLSARFNGRVSSSGAFLDSALDRFEDSAVIMAIAVLSGLNITIMVEAYTAVVGSLLTSYMRARAESLGLRMLGVGFFERPERLIYLFALTLTYALTRNNAVLTYGMGLFALITLTTAIQRTIVAYRLLKEKH